MPIRVDDLLHARVVEVERIESRLSGILIPSFAHFAHSPMTSKTLAKAPVEAQVEAPVGHSETEQSILEFCKDRPRS